MPPTPRGGGLAPTPGDSSRVSSRMLLQQKEEDTTPKKAVVIDRKKEGVRDGAEMGRVTCGGERRV
mgnify:CR=1 FL=1